jgi:hypothetical protein
MNDATIYKHTKNSRITILRYKLKKYRDKISASSFHMAFYCIWKINRISAFIDLAIFPAVANYYINFQLANCFATLQRIQQYVASVGSGKQHQ